MLRRQVDERDLAPAGFATVPFRQQFAEPVPPTSLCPVPPSAQISAGKRFRDRPNLENRIFLTVTVTMNSPRAMLHNSHHRAPMQVSRQCALFKAAVRSSSKADFKRSAGTGAMASSYLGVPPSSHAVAAAWRVSLAVNHRPATTFLSVDCRFRPAFPTSVHSLPEPQTKNDPSQTERYRKGGAVAP